MYTTRPKISIVIPTYNRPERLSQVLDAIFASEVDVGGQVEVIVVDDGSIPGSENVVNSKSVPDRFTLRYVWQENAGPAAARNHGFRLAGGDVVLCVDDDILLDRDAINWHLKAHKMMPGSVVFGQCIFRPASRESRSQAYLAELSMVVDPAAGLVPQPVVASGQISFERVQFAPDGPYRSDLRTPAAEEYELAFRLARRGIPIYLEPRATGTHLVTGGVTEKTIQEFKYGIAIGELFYKVPELKEFAPYATLIAANGFTDPATDSFFSKAKKAVKACLGLRPARNSLRHLAEFVSENHLPRSIANAVLRATFGIFLFAGVREGLKRFSSDYVAGKTSDFAA